MNWSNDGRFFFSAFLMLIWICPVFINYLDDKKKGALDWD